MGCFLREHASDSSLMSVLNALIRTLFPFPRPYAVLSTPYPPLFLRTCQARHIRAHTCPGITWRLCGGLGASVAQDLRALRLWQSSDGGGGGDDGGGAAAARAVKTTTDDTRAATYPRLPERERASGQGGTGRRERRGRGVEGEGYGGILWQ